MFVIRDSFCAKGGDTLSLTALKKERLSNDHGLLAAARRIAAATMAEGSPLSASVRVRSMIEAASFPRVRRIMTEIDFALGGRPVTLRHASAPGTNAVINGCSQAPDRTERRVTAPWRVARCPTDCADAQGSHRVRKARHPRPIPLDQVVKHCSLGRPAMLFPVHWRRYRAERD